MLLDDDIDQQESSGSSGINFKKIGYKIVRNYPWIIISLVLSFVAARVYLRYKVPITRASSNILVKTGDASGTANTVSVISDPFDANKAAENEVFILHSYGLVERIVDSLDLDILITKDGLIKKVPVDIQTLPFKMEVRRANVENKLRSYKLTINPKGYTIIDENKKKYNEVFGRVFLLNGDTVMINATSAFRPLNGEKFNISWSSKEDVVDKYLKRLSVNVAKTGKGIISLLLDDEIAERGQHFLISLIHEYDKLGVQFKNKSIRSSLQFLDDRLRIIGAEVQDQENQEERFRSSNDIFDVSQSATAMLDQLKTVDAQRNTNEYNQLILDALEKHVQRADQNEVFPASASITDPVLTSMVNNYNQLLQQRRLILDIGTPKDPTLEPVEGQLALVRKNLLQAINNTRRENSISKGYLSKKNSEYNQQFKNLPAKEQGLVRIRRQLTIKEGLYNFLLQRREETSIQLLSSDVENTRIIDYPRSLGVVEPNPVNVYLTCLAAGLLLPVFVIALLAILKNKIESKKDVEDSTKVPILGEVSEVDTGGKAIVTVANSRSIISEQFRTLRTNLSYIGTNSDKKVILFTSFISGEGKSFVALNLANILAQAGKKVLVMEFDLRKPKISERLGLPNKTGISNYIATNLQPQDIIKPLPEYSNLYFVNSGPIPPNAGELILSPKVEELIQYSRQHFDYVLIDSGPVGLVSDALPFAKLVDITLYIMRHNYTDRRTIEYLNELHQSRKLPNLSIVINGTDGGKNGYGYGYGYGSRYGYGYGNEDEADGKKTNSVKRKTKGIFEKMKG